MNILGIHDFIIEKNGGEKAGEFDIFSIPLKKGYSQFSKYISDSYETFVAKLDNLKSIVTKNGKYERNEMPVIAATDITKLKNYLTKKEIPFTITKEIINSLKPFQKQIYFHKIIKGLNDFSNTFKFIEDKFFITNKDNFLLDGHHRWAIAMMINPKKEVNVISLNTPKEQTFKILNDFTAFIGNEHNK